MIMLVNLILLGRDSYPSRNQFLAMIKAGVGVDSTPGAKNVLIAVCREKVT